MVEQATTPAFVPGLAGYIAAEWDKDHDQWLVGLVLACLFFIAKFRLGFHCLIFGRPKVDRAADR